jgi:hypothetical protein
MTTERKLWLTPSYQAHRLALIEGLFSAFLLVEHGNGAENVVPYYTLPLDFVPMSIPEAGFRLVLINVVYHCGFSSPCVTSCTLSVVELSARAHQMISILLWHGAPRPTDMSSGMVPPADSTSKKTRKDSERAQGCLPFSLQMYS